jgi:hypothetical protein
MRALTACLTAHIRAQSAIPALSISPVCVSDKSEAVLAASGRTQRDVEHELAEDDIAALARAVLRAEEPRGAKPSRREDHRTLGHVQLLPQRLPLWWVRGIVARGGVGRCSGTALRWDRA